MWFISSDIIAYLRHVCVCGGGGGRQTGRQFVDDIFRFIFSNQKLLRFHWNFTEYVPGAQSQ